MVGSAGIAVTMLFFSPDGGTTLSGSGTMEEKSTFFYKRSLSRSSTRRVTVG
jgi:hypothetical protein